jgi:hypothetical protein
VWCLLIVVGTWLFILMFPTGGAGPPNLAEIHGASGSGGCGMGACRRGYGRWDFYANASGLKRFWRWSGLSLSRPSISVYSRCIAAALSLSSCLQADSTTRLSQLAFVAAFLNHLDVSCFQAVICCRRSLTDDRFAIPTIILSLSFSHACTLARP